MTEWMAICQGDEWNNQSLPRSKERNMPTEDDLRQQREREGKSLDAMLSHLEDVNRAFNRNYGRSMMVKSVTLTGGYEVILTPIQVNEWTAYCLEHPTYLDYLSARRTFNAAEAAVLGGNMEARAQMVTSLEALDRLTAKMFHVGKEWAEKNVHASPAHPTAEGK